MAKAKGTGMKSMRHIASGLAVSPGAARAMRSEPVTLVHMNHPDGPVAIANDDTVHLDVVPSPKFETFKGDREKFPMGLEGPQRQTAMDMHMLLSAEKRGIVLNRAPPGKELSIGHFLYQPTKKNHAGVKDSELGGAVTIYDRAGRVMWMPVVFPTMKEGEACAALLNHSLRLLRDPNTHTQVILRNTKDYIEALNETAKEAWERIGKTMPPASMSAEDADHMLRTTGIDARRFSNFNVVEKPMMLLGILSRISMPGDDRA